MNKPRIMYILGHYPQISETYVQTEIDAVSEQYDVIVISLHDVEQSNAAAKQDVTNPLFFVTKYNKHNPYLVVNKFEQLCNAVAMFRPDVIHTHWLIRLPLVYELAKRTQIPFTVRAHSFDTIPSDNPISHSYQWHQAAHQVLPQTTRSELCLGILTYPFTRPFLEANGVPPHKIIESFPNIDYSRFHDTSPNGSNIMNLGACIPKKRMEDFVELAKRLPQRSFHLYPVSYNTRNFEQYNEQQGRPVMIHPPVEPSLMPAEYKKSEWLVYTASREINQVGWPLAAAEAQASGVGVLLPNLRPDMKDYLGDSGYVYDSIDEAAEIIAQPCPTEIRERGFENAKKSDIYRHKSLLTNLWESVV
jgi:hypothetical protein